MHFPGWRFGGWGFWGGLVLSVSGFGGASAAAKVDCEPQFPHLTELAVGSQPNQVVAADFTGDGLPDLAVVNRGSNSVTVWRNAGGRAFRFGGTLEVGRGPVVLRTADLDGDGRADLVVGDTSAEGTVSILLGNGDGTFRLRDEFGSGLLVGGLAVGDFNGDHRPDLAVVGGRSDLVVRLNEGTGRFPTERKFAGMAQPEGVVAGDFDGDGKVDLAAVDFLATNLVLWAGQGDGSFVEHGRLPTVPSPRAVVSGDVDGDGHLDLVAGGFGAAEISILRGRGDGGFQDAQNLPAGANVLGFALADLDGDRKADLAVTSGAGEWVRTFHGGGDGSFREAHAYSAGVVPSGVAVADFDGDGWPDLAVVDARPPGWVDGRVNVLWGGVGGDFEAPVALWGNDLPLSHAGLAVDLNHDGRADLVESEAGGELRVRLGKGDGSFQPPWVTSAGLWVVERLTSADLDGDGQLDLLAPSATVWFGPLTPVSYVFTVHFGLGDGRFESPSPIYKFLPTAGIQAEVGDFDGDGQTDVALLFRHNAAGLAQGSVGVFPGRKGRELGTMVEYPLEGLGVNLCVGEFTGDTVLDLIASHGDGVSLLPGKGDGTFLPAQPFAPELGSDLANARIAKIDLDADGRADLVALTGSKVLSWRRSGASGWAAPQEVEVPEGSEALRVADLNGDGHPDLVVASRERVVILSGNGDGGLSSNELLPIGAFGASLSVADLEGDGRPDLVLYGGHQRSMWTLVQNRCAASPEEAPRLTVERSGEILRFRWVGQSGVPVLESTESLSAPQWRVVIATATANGFELPLDRRSGAQFIRLRRGP